MLYSIKYREDLENLNKLVSLQSQVKAVRLQDKLGKQNFHENMGKVFEPVTKSLKNTSENLTKAITESSIENNQAIENLNNKLLEIMNDRGILASYLMSPLSKITNPENTSQFRLEKYHNSNRVNDLLMKNKIPITLYGNILMFRDTNKQFGLKGDLLEARENEWLPYVKNDVLSTAFCYARYTMCMEELTGFGMKNRLTLPSLANKYFNSLRDENDEPIYTYTDPFMRNFVRKAIKGGRYNAFNQRYKSEISDEVFNITSKELNVNGNICDLLEKYFEFLKKYEKQFAKEFNLKYDDYRDIDQKEKEKFVNRKLNMLPIHKELSKLDLKKTQMDFDATSLYPSAMWDENSIYPKTETGFAFKPHMNDVYVKAFNDQTFNKDGDESAILTIKYYNPPDLIFQHLPVKEKFEKIKVNRMRNGYIIDTLTSVDICEIVKIGGKVIEFYEGVIYRENFKISPFRKVIERLFALRQKYKDEKDYSMQGLVKLFMNSLYGVQIRKDINESYYCMSETWMKTEFDENVLDYWKLPNGNYIVKMKGDDGLDDDCDIKNTLPAVLGAFILSNSKRLMNNFIREKNGFYNNSVYYGDTDSLYIEKKYWNVMDKANLVGEGLRQGKNDYKTGGIFYGLYLAPKIKFCLTIDE